MMVFLIILSPFFITSTLFAQNQDVWAVLEGSPLLSSPFQISEPDEFKSMPISMEKTRVSRTPDMGSVHKYMGYGTLLLAAGAAFSSSSKDVHEPMGYAAATAATLTCFSGFMEYSDYFDTREGFSKYNIHIVSGVAATAGFIVTAILGAGGDDHGGIGGGSTVLMCVPIVILKW